MGKIKLFFELFFSNFLQGSPRQTPVAYELTRVSYLLFNHVYLILPISASHTIFIFRQ